MSHNKQTEFDQTYIMIAELQSTLNVSRQTIWNYRKQNRIPAPIMVNSKTPIWIRSEIELAIQSLKG